MPQMSYGGKYIKMEEYQFNTRLNGLIDAKDDDIIIDSDVDEIVKPELIKEYSLSNKPLIKVLQTFSVVWFNRKYDEQWRSGPMLASCKDLRNGTFNLFRRNDKFFYSRPDMGWHFSWTGGVNRIIEKSLDHSEMLCKKENFDYQKMLERIKNGYDQNGKELFDIEDKDLPDYVVKNREKFAKYFWPEGLKLTEDL
jgi:beta-1,4-mannosyl-glycoprotein beta-1,4-N-acetylglucosaminyltransferase